jgi:hypothetical protein
LCSANAALPWADAERPVVGEELGPDEVDDGVLQRRQSRVPGVAARVVTAVEFGGQVKQPVPIWFLDCRVLVDTLTLPGDVRRRQAVVDTGDDSLPLGVVLEQAQAADGRPVAVDG